MALHYVYHHDGRVTRVETETPPAAHGQVETWMLLDDQTVCTILEPGDVCSMTRTVVYLPEPVSSGLATALLLLAVIARRRRRM